MGPDHAEDLRHTLRSALVDIPIERPVLFGDQPGRTPLRQQMIAAHFPVISPGVEEWNR